MKPAAIYVWLVPSEEVLEQPGSWRIRKWDTTPFPEANYTLPERCEATQKGGMSMLMDEAGTRDTRRFEWLEANNTLHKKVEILYVVDGYEVQVIHEDGVTELTPPYRGDTIRAAIDEALRATSTRSSEEFGPCSCQESGKCRYVNGGPACMNAPT